MMKTLARSMKNFMTSVVEKIVRRSSSVDFPDFPYEDGIDARVDEYREEPGKGCGVGEQAPIGRPERARSIDDDDRFYGPPSKVGYAKAK